MNYFNSYSNFLKRFLKIKRPLRVVFDCSNGTTGAVLEKLAVGNRKLKAAFLNKKPDGNFPGHGPNPLAEGAKSQLEKEVRKQKADLGVIFDADGDRVFFVDDLGRSIDADKVGYILMGDFKPPVIISVISSWLLKKNRGMVICRVGHYFFKKVMRAKKAFFGAEPSGHYYFKEFFYCDSGILAAIKFINFISCLDIKLSKYLDSLPKYYRAPEMNFKTDNKKEIIRKIEQKYKNSASRIFKLDGLTMEFKDWWFNVRPSGTENLLRLNLEASQEAVLKKELENLKKAIQNR